MGVLAMRVWSSKGLIAPLLVMMIASTVHYFIYPAGVSVVRTLAFMTGAAATIVFAVTILGHVALG
jgi:hypothetical protein